MSVEDSIRDQIQAYLDDLLSEGERRRLFETLRQSPEAAREFARRVRLETSLSQVMKPESAWTLADFEHGLEPAHEGPSGGFRFRRQTLDHIWGPASAVLLHAALLLLILRWTLPSPEPAGESLARVDLRDAPAPLDSFESSLPGFDSRVALIPDHAVPPGAMTEAPDAAAGIGGMPSLAALPPDSDRAAGAIRLDVPDGFSTRTGAARAECHARFAPGWGALADSASLSGLDWLGTEQLPEGYWASDSGADLRATALGAAALLAFAPAPDDSKGRTARLAIRYLESRQDADGRFDSDPGIHAMATLVSAEAWTLWRRSGSRERLQTATRELTRASETEEYWSSAPAVDGGAPGWQAHALALILRLQPEHAEARLAAARLTGILKTRYDPAKGLFLRSGPVPPEERNRISALVVSALQALGEGRSPVCVQARQYLLRQRPAEMAADFAKSSPESLFFLFDALTQGPDPAPNAWLEDAAQAVLAAQDPSGAWPDARKIGTPLNTASAVLALSAHVRHPRGLAWVRPIRPGWALRAGRTTPFRSEAL